MRRRSAIVVGAAAVVVAAAAVAAWRLASSSARPITEYWSAAGADEVCASPTGPALDITQAAIRNPAGERRDAVWRTPTLLDRIGGWLGRPVPFDPIAFVETDDTVRAGGRTWRRHVVDDASTGAMRTALGLPSR